MAERHEDRAVDYLLGELEAAIMRRMWVVDSATVREMVDLLRADDRALAYTTVMTVMARLAEKQLLARELVGKTHVYHVALTKDQFLHEAAAKRVRSLVERFGELAIAQFLTEVDRLSPERRRELEAMAASARNREPR